MVGVGFDLVDVSRVRRLMARWGARFLDRILVPEERDYVSAKRRPEVHVAGLVAAKEACFKALGRGPGQGVGWHDIAIGHTAWGAPRVRLHGGAARTAQALGASTMLVSISHEDTLAGAVAVLLGGEPGVAR